MDTVEFRPSVKFIRLGYIAVLIAVVACMVVNQFATASLIAMVLFLWPMGRHLNRQFTKATILEDKLRYETGILSKFTRNIQLSKIQDVTVRQSFGQRLAGVGDISIETAGETSRLTIQNVDRPQQVADEITELAQKDTRGRKQRA
jgi:uncharacterized membrane protein YdbT with pleckstrin-like domain